jgi:hypothetical protein
MTTRYAKEIAVTVRENIKKQFPLCKFSVTVKNFNVMSVSLMSAPFAVFENDLDINGNKIDRGYAQLNHYQLKDERREVYSQELGKWLTGVCNGVVLTEDAWNLFVKVTEIANEENWDKSDIMTDYFNCNYYLHINIGHWDKPFVQTGKLPVTPVAVTPEPEPTFNLEAMYL